eukprot:412964-Alexandrium_andersonii.AAC.1
MNLYAACPKSLTAQEPHSLSIPPTRRPVILTRAPTKRIIQPSGFVWHDASTRTRLPTGSPGCPPPPGPA